MNKTEYIQNLRETLRRDTIGVIDKHSEGDILNISDETEVELLDNIICDQARTHLCFTDRTTAYQAVAMVLSKQAPTVADFIEDNTAEILYVEFDLSDYSPLVGKGFLAAHDKIVPVTTAITGVILAHDNSDFSFNIVSAFPVYKNRNSITIQIDCTRILEQTTTYTSDVVSNIWRIAARAKCGDSLLQDFQITYRPADKNNPEQLFISRRETPPSLDAECVALYYDESGQLQKSFENTDFESTLQDDIRYRSVIKKYHPIAAVAERDPALVRFTMMVMEQINNMHIIRQPPIKEPEPVEAQHQQDDTKEEQTEIAEEPATESAPPSKPEQPAKPVPRYSEMPTGPVKELADHKLFPAQTYSDPGADPAASPADYTNIPQKPKPPQRRGPTRPSGKPFGLKDIH